METNKQKMDMADEAGFEPSVPRDTTKVSRPPHVASADFPPTRKSRREHEPAPARTPGVFRGAESRILLPPAASLRTLGPPRDEWPDWAVPASLPLSLFACPQ